MTKRFKLYRSEHTPLSFLLCHTSNCGFAVFSADSVKQSYEWNQRYQVLAYWWSYDYIYEKRVEAWDLLYVRILESLCVSSPTDMFLTLETRAGRP